MTSSRFPILFLLLSCCLSILSCSPAFKTAASWADKEKISPIPYKSVFFIVLTGNTEIKSILEYDLAAAARAKGLEPYTSLAYFGTVTGQEGQPVLEALLRKVKELGCDIIFTVALKDKQSETRYVPGSTTYYAPYPLYGYYGTFGGYYNYSAAFYTPGYFSTSNHYFLESNVYDANTQEILMSIQSKADNPPAIEKSSKLYTASLVQEIENLRKKQ